MRSLPGLRPLHWLCGIAALALATGLAYGGMLGHGFLSWDDHLYVVGTPEIKSLGWQFLGWMLTTSHASNWHPLTWLSYALDYSLWGLEPRGYLLSNLLLHTLNSALVALFTAQLLAHPSIHGNSSHGRIWIAAGCIGLLFAVHPQHVEAVAWISQRKELLAFGFYLTALGAYLEFHASGRRRWYAFCLLSALLALMAKPMAVSLPIMLLLLDVHPLKRLAAATGAVSGTLGSARRGVALVLEKWPFLLASLAVMALTVHAQGQWGSIASLEQLGLSQRLANASGSLFFYLQKWLLPIGLSPFYPFPDWVHSPDWRLLVPVIALAVALLLALQLVRQGRPTLLLLCLAYGLSLAPVLGIVQVGDQAAADRYAYLPTLIFYLLLASLLLRLLAGRWGRVTLVATLALSFGLLQLTRLQVPVWANDFSLWTRVIELYPDRVAVAYANLANVASEAGDHDRALVLVDKALALDPERIASWRNRGLFLERLGRFEEARGTYEALIQADGSRPLGLTLLADLERRQGQLQSAQAHYLRVLAEDPVWLEARYGLAMVEYQLGQPEVAAERLQALLEDAPGYAEAWLLSAVLAHGRGELDRAREEYRRALLIRPDDVVARHNLALLDEPDEAEVER